MEKPKNLIGLWVVGLLLIIVLFLVLLYPGIDSLTAISGIFKWIFKLLVFLALLSFSLFILTEIRIYQMRLLEKDEEEKSGQTNRDAAVDDYRVNKGLNPSVDPDENYSNITGQLLKAVQASLIARSAFIYLYNSVENCYVRQGFQCNEPHESVENFQPEDGIFKGLELNSEPKVLHKDKINEDSLIYYRESPKVGSLLLVPIYVGTDKFIGFLGADSVDPEAWGEDDLNLASSFVNIFTLSVWQIDALDKLKTNSFFFTELCRLNTAFSLGSDRIDLFKEAGRLCRKFFEYDKLTLATVGDTESHELTIDFVDGYEADYNIGHTIVVNGGLWEKTMVNCDLLRIPDYDNRDFEFRFRPGDIISSPFYSAIGVSFSSGQKRFGGILLESFQKEAFSKEDENALSLLGKNVGSVISRLELFQSMKNLALIDGLTEMFNHRAFKERIQEEIDRCRRYETKLTLLILDLDKFKRINDTYGHLVGDFVLKKTSSLIRGSVRTVDTVARYGGEEFAIILINADKNSCFKTAERIRSNIGNFLYEKDNITERMTISIGMSEFPMDGEDLQSIIANADMAMYQAKRAGGNKVVIFNSKEKV